MRNKKYENYLRTLTIEELSHLAFKLYELYKFDGMPIINIYVTVKTILKEKRDDKDHYENLCKESEDRKEELRAIYPERIRESACGVFKKLQNPDEMGGY